MPEANGFCVILTQPDKIETMALAKVLAAARKTPLQDQVIPARRSWGIVAEKLSEPEAQALVEQLNPTVPCRAIPSSTLVSIPEPTPLTKWETGLALGCSVIAAAAINIKTIVTRTFREGPSAAQTIVSTGILLTTGLPIKLGPKKQTIVKKQEVNDQLYYLDILYENPPRHLRVDAQKMDYSALKERKLYNLLGNFKLILGDLAREAPSASRGQGTRIFLENKPIQSMTYESLKDLDRESRWLMTLRGL